MKKLIAILTAAAGILAADSPNAFAQTNVITVTNIVTPGRVRGRPAPE